VDVKLKKSYDFMMFRILAPVSFIPILPSEPAAVLKPHTSVKASIRLSQSAPKDLAFGRRGYLGCLVRIVRLINKACTNCLIYGAQNGLSFFLHRPAGKEAASGSAFRIYDFHAFRIFYLIANNYRVNNTNYENTANNN
jgi:hypothetical protein